jgi:hypothetical protein
MRSRRTRRVPAYLCAAHCFLASLACAHLTPRRPRAAQEAGLMSEAQRVLNLLYTRRDMTPNEARNGGARACSVACSRLAAPPSAPFRA